MARPNKPWYRASKDAWYATVEGKKISLGVKGSENEADALKAWHRLMANGRPESKPEAKEAQTVTEVIEAFLTDAEARLKPATVAVYRALLQPFAETKHGKCKADRFMAREAEAYAKGKDWSQSTQHDFLSALSGAFKFAGFPLTKIKKPPMESRGTKTIISEQDHNKLLESAPTYFVPFLRLLHLTGARPSEVAGITVENFDEANSVVRLKEHKTARFSGKPRLIFLSAEAVAILTEQRETHESGHLLRNHRGRPYNKNAIVHMMARLRQKTGVQATAYSYRHSFATDALAGGIPDAQVSALLGHSGTAMLHRHYSHLTERAQVLKEALSKVR